MWLYLLQPFWTDATDRQSETDRQTDGWAMAYSALQHIAYAVAR